MTCHDVATDDQPPHEPVTKFRLTEWAIKNWAIVVVILPLIGSTIGLYGVQYVGAVGVTKPEYQRQEARIADLVKASEIDRQIKADLIKAGEEENVRQNMAIAQLQTAFIDLKDIVKETQKDVKELLRTSGK